MKLVQRTDEVALGFDSSRARENAIRIWQAARWMDTPAVFRAAEIAAELLRDAGVYDVRIDTVPADGRTAAGGWIMPVAWKIDTAWLSIADRSKDASASLACYQNDPQSIAPLSPPTPGTAPGSGTVRVIETADEPLPAQLTGRFLLLRSGRPSEDLKAEAAAAGAIAVIATRTGAYPEAARFENAAVPKHADRSCIPSFSLSPAAADRLDRALAEDPDHCLEAKVCAKRYEGTAPVVTGTVGSGDPALYLCAHIDEIGALDNASGCGVAIEALRVLQEAYRTEASHSPRGLIRFFFSTEVRGWQIWLNRCEPRYRHYLAGINMDMNGADPEKEPGRLQVLTGFRHRPHFAGRLIRDAAEAASRLTSTMPTVLGNNFVSDSMPGISYPGGHVSLEQEPGESYHTSADTAGLLYEPTLRWSGVACVHFLYRSSRLGADDVAALSERLYDELSSRLTGDDAPPTLPDGRRPVETPAATAAKNQQKLIRRGGHGRLILASLSRAVPPSAFPIGVTDPEELYASSQVRRADGLSGETIAATAVQDLRARWERMLRGRLGRSRQTADVQDSRAYSLVPRAEFVGFLGFDNQYPEEARKELHRRTGLVPSWGTEAWAWMLAGECRGKRRLSDIVTDLRALGVEVDLNRAADLIEYLAEIRLVTLRPILTEADLVAGFVEAGVRDGGLYAVHASLSRFGLIDGGAATVVAALQKAAGPGATIAMPTHTLSFLGSPAYERERTPGLTGAVPELLRSLPGVQRSVHATHSVAVLGPQAENLVSGIEPAQRPMDREGFWGRLYDLDGQVVLLCPIRSATMFHAGEAWSELPQPSAPVHWIDESGERRIAMEDRLPWHVDHFQKLLAEPLIEGGVMKRYALGDSEFFVAPARAMGDISYQVNQADRRVTLGSGGTCGCAYCRYLRDSLGE